jgi:hypothetical protein
MVDGGIGKGKSEPTIEDQKTINEYRADGDRRFRLGFAMTKMLIFRVGQKPYQDHSCMPVSVRSRRLFGLLFCSSSVDIVGSMLSSNLPIKSTCTPINLVGGISLVTQTDWSRRDNSLASERLAETPERFSSPNQMEPT